MLHLSKINGRHDTLFQKECCEQCFKIMEHFLRGMWPLLQENLACRYATTFSKNATGHPAVKGFIFSISIAPLAMEGCFMLKGTFQNIYHTLIKGHYTLSKEYCIHSKALFWIKLSDCNMQLQTN